MSALAHRGLEIVGRARPRGRRPASARGERSAARGVAVPDARPRVIGRTARMRARPGSGASAPAPTITQVRARPRARDSARRAPRRRRCARAVSALAVDHGERLAGVAVESADRCRMHRRLAERGIVGQDGDDLDADDSRRRSAPPSSRPASAAASPAAARPRDRMMVADRHHDVAAERVAQRLDQAAERSAPRRRRRPMTIRMRGSQPRSGGTGRRRLDAGWRCGARCSAARRGACAGSRLGAPRARQLR